MTPGSLELREELLRLLAACDADPRLSAEHARAWREFFGGDELTYAVGEAAVGAAEIRFAEWYLIERENDNLGICPLDHFAGRGESADAASFDLLGDSLCSVFIVESGKSERPRVRDLQGGDRHDLVGVPDPLRAGDILVGRIFEAGTGAYVPSCVMAILSASPQVAVAFQKDLKQLGIDRRLSQAELEHLLFRRWGKAAADEQVALTKPVERLEADLEKLLEQAGVSDQYTATDLSATIKMIERPGAEFTEFMDEMAFDTDVDLDRLRVLLTELWAAHHQGAATTRQAAAEDLEPRVATADRPQETEKQDPDDDGRPLGTRIAERLEQGLAGAEDIEDLFDSVESMLGEKIEEPDNDEVAEIEMGDVEALGREFVWEAGIKGDDETLLARFFETLRAAPIPHTNLEGLRVDDYLRFLLDRWLGSSPTQRVALVERAFRLLERFVAWAESTQGYGLEDHLGEANRMLISDLERMQSVSLQLSTGEQPDQGNGKLVLMEVVTGDCGAITVLVGEAKDEVEVEVADPVLDLVREHDFLVGGIEHQAENRARLSGMVLMVPAALGHLLG